MEFHKKLNQSNELGILCPNIYYIGLSILFFLFLRFTLTIHFTLYFLTTLVVNFFKTQNSYAKDSLAYTK